MKYNADITKFGFNSVMKKATNSEALKAKKLYDEFVKSMNKSDFCNSERRYIAELSYVKRLIEFYSKENCSDLLVQMQDKETRILAKLKNEFGITFN